MRTIGAGRYELEAEIANGAIGTVWRARDTRTGDRVAVKLLRPAAAAQAAAVRAFLAEARILLALLAPGAPHRAQRPGHPVAVTSPEAARIVIARRAVTGVRVTGGPVTGGRHDSRDRDRPAGHP